MVWQLIFSRISDFLEYLNGLTGGHSPHQIVMKPLPFSMNSIFMLDISNCFVGEIKLDTLCAFNFRNKIIKSGINYLIKF